MSNKITMTNKKKKSRIVGHIPTRCMNPPCSNFLPQQVIQVPIACQVHDEAQLKLEACPAIANNDICIFFKFTA